MLKTRTIEPVRNPCINVALRKPNSSHLARRTGERLRDGERLRGGGARRGDGRRGDGRRGDLDMHGERVEGTTYVIRVYKTPFDNTYIEGGGGRETSTAKVTVFSVPAY